MSLPKQVLVLGRMARPEQTRLKAPSNHPPCGSGLDAEHPRKASALRHWWALVTLGGVSLSGIT